MRIIDQELNVSRFKHYLGKEGLYFHGASNDRINYDPNHKKILPPSPEHPFFVSDDPTMAVRYANMETDDNGRITDRDTEFTENSRVYILRLKDDVARTRHFFDFTDKSDIEKLGPLFSCKEGFDIFKKKILDQGRMMFYVCLQLADLDRFDIHDKVVGKPDAMELARKLVELKTSVGETLDTAALYGSLAHNFKNLDHHPDRRDLKTVFFKFILDELHFKVIGEYDTWGSYWHPEDKITEFGILDMSVIRDIYPFPIPFKYARAAATITNWYYNDENPFNLSRSSYFLGLVDFIAKDPELVEIYNYEAILKRWFDAEAKKNKK